MSIITKVRAHHLLCMQGFQGYGYNDNFVSYLKNVIERFKANPNMIIQVVDYCDVICSGCPHQVEHMCNESTDSEYQIKTMNLNVLKYTGIQSNSIGTIQEMQNRINNTFKNQKQLVDVCGDCQWSEKCIWYNSLE